MRDNFDMFSDDYEYLFTIIIKFVCDIVLANNFDNGYNNNLKGS